MGDVSPILANIHETWWPEGSLYASQQINNGNISNHPDDWQMHRRWCSTFAECADLKAIFLQGFAETTQIADHREYRESRSYFWSFTSSMHAKKFKNHASFASSAMHLPIISMIRSVSIIYVLRRTQKTILAGCLLDFTRGNGSPQAEIFGILGLQNGDFTRGNGPPQAGVLGILGTAKWWFCITNLVGIRFFLECW